VIEIFDLVQQQCASKLLLIRRWPDRFGKLNGWLVQKGLHERVLF